MVDLNRIIDVAESLEWNVEQFDDEFYFSKYSSAGQDFNIIINLKYDENGSVDTDLIIDELEDFVDDYDISYETYIWLDNTGHGRNGAPYEMIDVYRDMESCLEMTKELLYELQKIKEE